jgi:hypothetical protein
MRLYKFPGDGVYWGENKPLQQIHLSMKTPRNSLTFGFLVFGTLFSGCSKNESHVFSSLKNPATVTQLKDFVAEKNLEANSATNEPSPAFAPFFAAAEKGDWLAVSNAFEDMRKHAGQYQSSGARTDERLHGPRWAAVLEIWGAFYYFGHADEKYSAAFGNDIIQSIPAGSIYFGGTDPGRFVVTAMEKSQVKGDPFFVLTQNALADPTYLDYVRSLYADRIYIPTPEDLQKCFQDYTDDAQRRLASHQLKPGENVTTDANGKVQVSGQVAVMDINARLVRVIFDQNANRDFYVEESFPLDWMYPYLEPHGLIMKVNHEPAGKLSEEVLQADRDYWTKYLTPIIGDWLNDNTTVQEVAAFVEKTYGKQDLSAFKGDRRFLASRDSQMMFSKLRSSIAGIYSWRLGVSPSGGQVPPQYTGDKERMAREADFAFKQAIALCPYLSEAVNRYVDFLTNQGRKPEALLIAQAAVKADPKNDSFRFLVLKLSR